MSSAEDGDRLTARRAKGWAEIRRRMPAQKPGKSVQEVGTPRAFLDAVETRFGKIAWDLAANETNHVVDEWSGPGSTKQPDSLKGAWLELPPGLFWLNPPYANIGDWVEKCDKEQREGYGNSRAQRIALLVPASVGTKLVRFPCRPESTGSVPIAAPHIRRPYSVLPKGLNAVRIRSDTRL